ncbi:MAG: Rep domain protein [Cressdnaviricota sp.]|nr:MAG: Rep domain protein [Cressdnaviricota sp.]
MLVQSVPSCSMGENGNNVSHSPPVNALYKYDFVINNYTTNEVCSIKSTIRKLAKKGVCGFETGESGTPHIQGCIFLKRKMRITALTKEPGFERASCRAIRNDEATIKYCRKDGEFWDYGFPKPIKVIEVLRPWQQKCLDLYLTEPNDRHIHWFWESVGNVGKSAFIKYMIVNYSILFSSGGKHADIINLVFNQDMDNCNGVFFNIPRSHKGRVDYASLECIKDGMICNTKYETGVKIFNSPHVFVFANFPPEDNDEMSADMWQIVEL